MAEAYATTVHVDPEHFWRDVWHRHCPQRGPMRQTRSKTITIEDGSVLWFHECVGCGVTCYAGLDAKRFVVTRPVPEAPHAD